MSDSSNPTNIFEAAEAGDLLAVQSYVNDQHVNVNARNPASGETPLLKAAQGGHLDVIKYLLSNGASINHTDKWGYNALLWAMDTHKASLDVIKYLVDNKINVNQKDKLKGYTVLHWAAFHCDQDTVEYLLSKGLLVNAAAINGETPLERAAANNCMSVVEYLIDSRGVNYNIFKACRKGFTNLVRYFMDRKNVRVHTYDSEGFTPLHQAAYGGHLDTVKYLVEEKRANVNAISGQSERVSPLHSAAGDGHNVDVVRYLVDQGADPYARNVHGRTALYHAAGSDQLDIVKYFVNDLNMNFLDTDNYGNTLLHAAGWNGAINVVTFLVEEKKMNVNVQDNEDAGNTPLTESLQRGKFNIFYYLMKQSSLDCQKQDKIGNTALHYAALYGYLNEAQALIAKGADVNKRNREGRTPLYFSADGTESTGGHLSVVRYFVDDLKADVNQRDNYGNTLLHAAQWYNSLDVVKYLVDEKKVNVNAKDNDGNTPLGESISRGRTEIVKYLESKGGKRNRRRRRDISEAYAEGKISYATNSAEQHFSLINSLAYCVRNTAGLLTSSSSGSGIVKTDMTSSVFDGLLILFDVGVRRLFGTRYDRHPALLSPIESIERRIDENVTSAVQSLSKIFDYEELMISI